MKRILVQSIMAATAAILLAGIPQDVAAQEDAKLQRLKAALPQAAASALQQLVVGARERGLPTEPLLDKALEGTAKRVPPDRILVVVEQRLDQLARAKSVLGTGTPVTPSDITTVADVLERGVPEKAVRALRKDARPNEPLAISVHALADLLHDGVSMESALELLEAWRGRGCDPEELGQYQASVAKLVREGTPPAHAARSVAAAVRRGAAPGSAVPPGHVGPRGPPGKGKAQGPPLPPGDKGKKKGQG